MAIDFHCPNCSKLLRVPYGSEGLLSECPACSTVVTVPGPRANSVPSDLSAVASPNANTINVPCPKCLHLLQCSPKLLGTKGQCPQCQHIFTIQSDLSPAAVDQIPDIKFVFTCPSCGQLFEGKEEMNGRKGKCHVCQSVFVIAIKTSGETPKPVVGSAQSAAPARREIEPTHRANVASESPKASAEPTKPNVNTPSKSPVRDQARTLQPDRPIRFACDACTGILEVPGATMGLETACPFCNKILTIPDPKRLESSAPTTKIAAAPETRGKPETKPISPKPTAQPKISNPYLDPVSDPSLLSGPDPFAVPESQAWSVPTPARSKHKGSITFAKSLNIMLDRSFPGCLYLIAQAILPALPIGLLFLVAQGLRWATGSLDLALDPVTARTIAAVLLGLAFISTLILSLIAQAWMFNLTLHCIRGGAVNSEVFFGGTSIVLKLVLVSFLASFVSGIFVLITLAPVMLVASSNPLVTIVALILTFPFWMLPYLSLMFAPFAMLDGEEITKAVGTSLKIFFDNWLVIMGVVFAYLFVHVILTVLTLGLASGLPLFLVASMYIQVRPKASR